MARKHTPNVLGDLMGEERQQTVKPASQQDGKLSNQQAGKAASQQPLNERLASADKTKVTLYLSPATAYELEAAKLELRRVLDPDNLKDVTKSSITETALLIALRDLAERGERSDVAAELETAVDAAAR